MNRNTSVMPKTLQESKLELFSAEQCHKLQNTDGKIVCAGYPGSKKVGCIVSGVDCMRK